MARLPRILLLLSSLVFFGFGVAFFVDPTGLTANVDLAVETATARSEIRAMYGGLQVAFGLFLGWCALSPAKTAVGLLASGSLFLGLAAGRLGGILLAGEGSLLLWELLAAETVAAALSLYGWWLARHLLSGSTGDRA